MAAPNAHFVQLARNLPPRLQQFLARWPPASILAPFAATADGTTVPTQTEFQKEIPNPFVRTKHPVTGKWHDPVFSLRRQAELVKMAREHNCEELLPDTPKKTETRLRKRVEFGLRVKGTGVGQKPKGQQHERFHASKMEERRKAMLGMGKLIREWKTVGKKNWTRYPK